MSRNAGSVALERLSKTQDEVARIVGVSSISVHYWRSGKKKPAAAMRQKLFDAFKIPVGSWDELPTKAKGVTGKLIALPSPPPSRGGDDASTAGGVFGMARDLERQARSLLKELEAGMSTDGIAISPLERAKVMSSVATTLDKLTKITGQHDLGRKVMKLPMFKHAVEEIVKALKPFPGAAKAVAARMTELEQEALKAG